jgi:hypothetical protein
MLEVNNKTVAKVAAVKAFIFINIILSLISKT